MEPEPLLTCVPVVADAAVHGVLHGIGRTEDVRFSPDNRRLALTAFHENRLLLLDVAVEDGATGLQVRLRAVTQLSAAEITEPHGVDFLDDDTIVVANRSGDLSVHALPIRGTAVGAVTGVRTVAVLDGIDSPGSVRVLPTPTGTSEVVVCDNRAGALTVHAVHHTEVGPVVDAGTVHLRRWLDIPDGVAGSADSRWLAVSNHGSQSVLVYDRAAGVDERSPPDAILRGVAYPHGLAFTPDGRHLVVADAARPLVHVFEAGDDGWAGTAYPVATHRIKEDDAYTRHRRNPQEGGPKGLDLDRTGSVAVVTSEGQPLACFAVADLRATSGEAGGPRRLDYEHEALEHATTREVTLAHAILRADQANARADEANARAEGAEAEARRHADLVDAYERTKLFRYARPFRDRYAAWRNRGTPRSS